MENLLEKYKASQPLELPIIHPNNMRISQFTVYCLKCNQETTDVRGDSLIHSNCIEIKAGGYCSTCNFLTWSKMRYYGNYILHWNSENEIVRYEIVPMWKGIIINMLAKIKKFLFGN